MPSKIYAEIPYLLQGTGAKDPAWRPVVRVLTSLGSALEADLARMEQRLDPLEAEAIEPEQAACFIPRQQQPASRSVSA